MGDSMKLSLRGGRALAQRLHEMLQNPDHAYINITQLDGSTTEIKDEMKGEFEVGQDYILINVMVQGSGPMPYAPTIIPFSSIKSIDIII
jgi:hypothetical protein